MSSRWQTAIFPLVDGLNLDKSHIHLAQTNPGSAIYLLNLEVNPNREGYHKTKGFIKFSESIVPDGGNSNSRIRGVYAFNDDTVVVSRNSEIYTSIGGVWTKRNSTTLTNESIKLKGVSYRFSGNRKTMLVDGANIPFTIDQENLSFNQISSAPSDVQASSEVEVFRNRLWFAKDSLVTYTAPNTDNDFASGNGAGVINTGDTVVGLKVFRDTLIIFHQNGLKRVTGTTSSDFQVEDLFGSSGCVDGDTIQSIYGDVVYLSYDGIRFVSDTDRSTGFSLSPISRKLGNLPVEQIQNHSSFSSCIVNSKNQYRLFFYDFNTAAKDSSGFCGTQLGTQGQNNFSWNQLKGFKAFSTSYSENSTSDFIVFCNETEYVYQMERSSSLDGNNIEWAYWGPYLFFDDPIKRKTVHNAYFYGVLTEQTQGTLAVKIDFEDSRVIQPNAASQGIGSGVFSGGRFGEAIYGVDRFGGEPLQRFYYTTVGNGLFFSFRIYGEGTEDSFVLDTLVIEYSLKDRQ